MVSDWYKNGRMNREKAMTIEMVKEICLAVVALGFFALFGWGLWLMSKERP